MPGLVRRVWADGASWALRRAHTPNSTVATQAATPAHTDEPASRATQHRPRDFDSPGSPFRLMAPCCSFGGGHSERVRSACLTRAGTSRCASSASRPHSRLRRRPPCSGIRQTSLDGLRRKVRWCKPLMHTAEQRREQPRGCSSSLSVTHRITSRPLPCPCPRPPQLCMEAPVLHSEGRQCSRRACAAAAFSLRATSRRAGRWPIGSRPRLARLA